MLTLTYPMEFPTDGRVVKDHRHLVRNSTCIHYAKVCFSR